MPKSHNDIQSKACTACGREIQWRKRWERDWESVRYCSRKCRSGSLGETDAKLERAILELLESRDWKGTICPSEAARRVAPDGWQKLMEPARGAARRLVNAGRVEITQKGRAVDPSRARGPIRIRLISNHRIQPGEE